MTRERLSSDLDKAKTTPGFDSNDKIRQLQAILALDVSAPFGGSMDRAAAAVKARVLVVPSMQDRAVNPVPALDFARLLHAPTLKLESDYGHLSPGRESEK